MSLIDLLLNVAALLLWVVWRSLAISPFAQPAPMSLSAALQPARVTTLRRRLILLALVLLLLLRAPMYWHVGSAVNWMPTLRVGVVGLTFRSDYLSRMFLFSWVSFARLFVIYYSWLFLLAAINRDIASTNPVQKWIRQQLGWLNQSPAILQFLLPLPMGALAWAAVNPVFQHFGLLPPPESLTHLSQQALVVGVGTFLAWKTLIVAVLLLNLVNAYVFLGNLPLWAFVNATARNLLRPLQWLPLRWHRTDLTPVIGVILVFSLAEAAAQGLTQLYHRLPL